MLFILGLVFACQAFAQIVQGDTVAYKIGYYEVKKKQSLTEIAEKLKVEPAVVAKLNRLKTLQQYFVNGDRIKIPVYANGYKYEPAKPVKETAPAKTEKVAPTKPTEAPAAKKTEEKKKAPAKKDGKEPVVVQPVAVNWDPRLNYDPEIDQNNFMLVDATLELNEAMLAGIKASLDTLDKPDPEIKNGNDVKEILQRMKRARDRKELIPYLEYMRDSLSLDCSKLKTQKEDILSRLNPYYEHLRVDSINALAQKDLAAKNLATTPAAKPGKKKEKEKEQPIVVKRDTVPPLAAKEVVAKHTEKEKPKEVKPVGRDTVLVYDVAKPATKTEKEKATTHSAKRDTVALASKETAKSKPNKSVDTVVIADVPKPKTSKKDDAKADAKKKPEKEAQEVVVVIEDVKEAPAKEQPQPTKKADAKEQPIAIEPVKKADTIAAQPTPVAKAPEKKTPADASANFDTIQNIKSQFLVKRAQKAIAEKKENTAEEYLQKATELWKDNYEAWMTWADMHARSGEPVKALAEYQECVRIDASRPNLFYKMASLYMQSKKKTEAMQYFTRTIAVDGNYILAYMGRASIYSDWKQYDAAIADYDKVLTVNKNYHYAFKARGMVKQLNRNFKDAIKDFSQYLTYEETDPSAYYYRGLAKIGNNELLEGCLDLSKASEMGYEAAENAIKKSCE